MQRRLLIAPPRPFSGPIAHLLCFLLVSGLLFGAISARAEPGYDMYVGSTDFQPGHPVWVNVTGPANMTISIRITDKESNIIAGRDASLDAAGTYTFDWQPSSEGTYNATVTFATGMVITRQFTVQEKVTSEDIGELYRALTRVEERLKGAFGELQRVTYVAIAMSILSFLFALYVYNRTRKSLSRAESELERWLKEDIEGALRKLSEKK